MTHHMKLQPQPFEMILCGSKTIELRLNDEKRKRISVGDRIVFTNTEGGKAICASVINLYVFDSFSDLYNALPLDKCGYLKEELPSASYMDMYRYYTCEQEKKYGVVGIEMDDIELCENANTD